MSDERGFTSREVTGLLPGGWTLADPADPGGWDESGKRWRICLVDGAEVEHEARVEAEEISKHGRVEALRRELDRLYRGVVPRGIFG